MADFPRLTAGVDEAGRGPLAGPVFAAAVILNPKQPVIGLADSKQLTAPQRAQLETEIYARALAFGVAQASVDEIDTMNILNATMLAMQRAVGTLATKPQLVLVDGNRLPELTYPSRAIVRGDALHAEISAASILAKQARDRYMQDLARHFPEYGFQQHKGYGTPQHRAALQAFGASIHHRRSFAPLRHMLARQMGSA